MKTDPYYQQQTCSTMTVVSGNMRFMWIFAGVPWWRGVKHFWGNRKRRFWGLSDTVRLRNLRKGSQIYYIVLFSPLSPFHWLHNIRPWTTVNGHFTSSFHYYEQRFQTLFCIFIVEPIYRIFLWYHVAIRDVRKRTVIRRIFGIRGRTADLS